MKRYVEEERENKREWGKIDRVRTEEIKTE